MTPQSSIAKQGETMQLTEEELNLIRQWFNAVEDLNPKYLEKADKDLIEKIRVFLGVRS